MTVEVNETQLMLALGASAAAVAGLGWTVLQSQLTAHIGGIRELMQSNFSHIDSRMAMMDKARAEARQDIATAIDGLHKRIDVLEKNIGK